MRRGAANGDPPAGETGGIELTGSRDGRNKAPRQHQVDIGEIEKRAVLGRDRETGDQCVALLVSRARAA